MSATTKKKHVTKEVLEEFPLPDWSRKVVMVTGSKGNNLHEVKTPTGEVFLVSMPTKFRKHVWIKRGDYILVDPIEEGGKVKAEISHILFKEQIKHIQEHGKWPEAFTDKIANPVEMIPQDLLPPSGDDDDDSSDDLADLVVNLNRVNVSQVQSDDSDDDEDDDEDDDDDEELVPAPIKKNIVAAKKPAQQVAVKTGGNQAGSEESSSEEEDDSDDEVVPIATKATQQLSQQKKLTTQQVTVRGGQKVTAKESSSDEEDDDSDDEEEDDSDDEEETTKPTKQTLSQKKQPVTQKLAQVEDSDEDDDSSEEEDEEDNSPDEEDSDDDEEEDEQVAVKVLNKNKRKIENVKKGPANKKQKVEAEPQVKTKAGKTKKVIDKDDSDEDDDEEEEEETVKAPESKKRKKKEKTKKEVAKKQKLEAVNGDGVPVTLFVGNLTKDTTEEELTEIFTKNNISVTEVRKLLTKRTAFVDLEDSDDLEKALTLNGTTLKKVPINIERAKPRPQTQPIDKKTKAIKSPGDKLNKEDSEKDQRTLFVKHLPEDVTVESLSDVFDTAIDVRVPKKDGTARGYGFIEFPDKEAMEAAMSEKQGVEFNGSTLLLDYTGSRSTFKKQRGGLDGNRSSRGGFEGNKKPISSGSRGESKILFVKNLSFNTDESSLTAAFKGATSARIPTSADTGKSKGFAFVEFKTPEAAANALDSMKGLSIDGRQLTLDFAADKGSGARGGFTPRGRGSGRGGGRGFGPGRGGNRGGQGNRGGYNKARGGFVQSQGKKTKFNGDSD
uniref:RNA-binding protein EIF1AD n=1 Tax=Arion vulgaris TaxID=1028688 RepID=A0A0B7ANH4_9EUPU